MKLAVISDLHLGQRMYRTEDGYLNKYEKAGYKAFEDNIRAIIKEQPDIIIYCGDIFDTGNAPILALEKFKVGLSKLRSMTNLIILGNHDFNFNNKLNDCNAVDLVISDNNIILADYSIKTYEKDNFLFVLMPYLYAKQIDLEDYFQNCLSIARSSNACHKILITHGVTDNYVQRFPELQDKFLLSDELVNAFDEVFIGHIHKSFDYVDNGTLVVSPGALINYQEDHNTTGPVIMEFDQFGNRIDYRKINIETPYLIKRELNEKTINPFLSKVTNKIYNITYNGDISKIDNDLFIKAKSKAINIVIALKQVENLNTTEIQDCGSFFDWIKNTYPDKLSVFQNAKNVLCEEV